MYVKLDGKSDCVRRESGVGFTGTKRKEKRGCRLQQVYAWTNKYAEQGEAGLQDRRGQRNQGVLTPMEERYCYPLAA